MLLYKAKHRLNLDDQVKQAVDAWLKGQGF